MNKTIEEIVITPEGIDVISSINNGKDGVVYNVTQLSLIEQENERKEIFEKNNLSNLANYPFDMNIVRALSDNPGQLRDYLETCRRANYSKGKIEMPKSIPDILYDLKNLKNGFENKGNDELKKNSQIEMFKTAKETKRLLNGKVKIKMGVLDRAYFTIQELFQNIGSKSVQALQSGVVKDEDIEKNTPKNEFVEELKNPKYTELTNKVSKEYTEIDTNNPEVTNTASKGDVETNNQKVERKEDEELTH